MSGIILYDHWNASPRLCQLSYTVVGLVQVLDLKKLSVVPDTYCEKIRVVDWKKICYTIFFHNDTHAIMAHHIISPQPLGENRVVWSITSKK